MEFEPKEYPLGESVLVCEYSCQGKREDCRVLLPANILKTLHVHPPEGEFRSSKQYRFEGEKKILKDALNYFEGGVRTQEGVSCSLVHEQTQTKLLLTL